MKEIDYQEIITSYNDYIVKIEKGCIYIANELRQGNKKAMKNIIDFSEGLEWLILTSRELRKENVETNLDESYLIDQLQELNYAIQQDDLFLVADLFEYEMADYFKSPVLIKGEN